MFNEELVSRIKTLYQSDPEMIKRLLSLDPSAIREMTLQSVFNPEMITYAYEHGKIEELYKEAKRQEEIIKLYHDLLLIYSESQVINNQKKL